MGKRIRITPNCVKTLQKNEIFVFASNLAGRHDTNDAKTAVIKWGAKHGKGIGLQGNTYALPTKNGYGMILSTDRIKVYVDIFIKHAKDTPDFKYFVTEIGCDHFRYEPMDIAPLFKKARTVDNIFLPKSFWDCGL